MRGDSMDALLRWLHVFAAILWLGGKLFTSLVLNPVLRANISPEQRAEIAAALGARLKYLNWGSLAALIITGVVNALPRVPALDALFSTKYGALLLGKTFIVAAMVSLSAMHTFLLIPRLKFMKSEEKERARLQILLLTRLNLVLGALVVLLAVLLVHGA